MSEREMHFDGMDLWAFKPDGLDHVAEIWNGHEEESDQRIKIGKRLALAWNCHEELLEAAENALDILIASCIPARTAVINAQAQLRAAISKASGGQQ